MFTLKKETNENSLDARDFCKETQVNTPIGHNDPSILVEGLIKEEIDIGPTVLQPYDIQYMSLPPCKSESLENPRNYEFNSTSSNDRKKAKIYTHTSSKDSKENYRECGDFNNNSKRREPSKKINQTDFKKKETQCKLSYECAICKYKFTMKGNMTRHYKQLHSQLKNEMYSCNMCGKGFKCKNYIRDHIRRVHRHTTQSELEIVPIPCTSCPKTFMEIKNLKRHVNVVHLKMLNKKCNYCYRMYSTVNKLNNHMRVCGAAVEKASGETNVVTEISCVVCNKTYTHPESLKYHMKYHHEPRTDLKRECSICHRVLFSRSGLKRHMILKHLVRIFKCKNSRRKPNLQSSDIFACENCTSTFASKQMLSRHMQTACYTGPPRECKFCGKFLKCASYLYMHMKTYHPNNLKLRKNHTCDHCSSVFTSKKALNKHVKTLRRHYVT